MPRGRKRGSDDQPGRRPPKRTQTNPAQRNQSVGVPNHLDATGRRALRLLTTHFQEIFSTNSLLSSSSSSSEDEPERERETIVCDYIISDDEDDDVTIVETSPSVSSVALTTAPSTVTSNFYYSSASSSTTTLSTADSMYEVVIDVEEQIERMRELVGLRPRTPEPQSEPSPKPSSKSSPKSSPKKEPKAEGKKEPTVCPICLETLTSKIEVVSTMCGHLFCKACLELYMKKEPRPQCPTCRKPVKAGNVHPVYL